MSGMRGAEKHADIRAHRTIDGCSRNNEHFLDGVVIIRVLCPMRRG